VPNVLVANHKGGVGKTMATTGIAAELAKAGHYVLVVDADPQGNLSRRMGYLDDRLVGKPTVGRAITYGRGRRYAAELEACIVPCQWEGDWADRIYLAPGGPELEARAAEQNYPDAWQRLRSALSFVDPGWCVLIDTPPSMGHLMVMALAASDHVLTVTEPEFDSVQGALHLREFIEVYRDRLELQCDLDGVIVNAARKVAVHEVRWSDLQAHFGEKLWEPKIPLRASIAENQEFGIPPQTNVPATGRMFAKLSRHLLDVMRAPAIL